MLQILEDIGVSSSNMELTAVRPNLKKPQTQSILRAEFVNIVLWPAAVAQLVACSSFVMNPDVLAHPGFFSG